MQKKILQFESSALFLRKKARELTLNEIESDEIQSLILEMKQIMRDAPGVGVAAPQIGVSIQLAVIEDPIERLTNILPNVLKDRSRESVPFHVIINPKIIQLSGQMNYFFEGCLSIKNYARVTPRHHIVQVEYLNEKGEQKVITAQGWYARILQHEIGHLNGELYIDFSDPRTEALVDDEYIKKWSNAMQFDIIQFFRDKCPEKRI
ncbi:MAG: peptide deformylase [Gammaproteobacteria bacterium]|nr:peptide deformylase [Gammaproteobacteria bacterium]